MKRFFFVSVLFAICGLVSQAAASVAITFSNSVSNVLSGFANSAGVATNGMLYGIVVDTGGNGFNAGAYTAFDPTLGGFLSTLGGATDDYFWSAAGGNTNDTGFTFDSTLDALGDVFQEAGGGVGGPGTVLDILNVPFGGLTGISTGDAFQIIWFQSNTADAGDRYGMFSHVSFVIPGDGATLNLESNFGTTDPIKPANLTIQAIPEPSRAVLLGLGVLGIVFRRRRG